MRIIKLANRRKEHVLSPWLNTEESCEYLGISRETFRKLNTALPCPATGGTDTAQRFHSAVLDQWWTDVKAKHIR